MSDLVSLLAAGNGRLQWAMLSFRLVFVLGSVSGFFNTLNRDVVGIALSAGAFFFAMAAIFYMASGATGNERTRAQAVGWLYAACAGVALAILSNTITTLVSHAATGQ
jgi:hypothetical protein